MMPARGYALAGACAVLLAAGGCGGQSREGAQRPEGGQTETTAASAGAVKVGMENIKYVPERVTVPVGGKVVWTNSDTPPHTVTWASGPGGSFDSGNLPPGARFERTFTKPGTISYFCTIHSGQTGTIVVR